MFRCVLALLLVSVVASAADQDEPGDHKKLQGTWKVLSVEVDGEKAKKEKFEKFRIVITADTFTMGDGDGKDNTNKYKIDPSAKPKALDLIATKKGAKPGQKIYDLDGDSLKICWDTDRSKDRPKAFESKPKSGIVLLVLKREK